MRRKTDDPGFSLVETLIVTSIAAIVGVLVLMILVQNNGLFTLQQAKVEQGLNINDASYQIENSIKSASSVAASYTSGGTTYTSSLTTLVLSVPTVNASGSVLASTYDYIVITKDSQNQAILKKFYFPDIQSSHKSENMVLSTKLLLANFYYYNSLGTPVTPTSAVSVNFVITLKNQLGIKNEQSSASSQVNLRNN